MSRFEPMVRVIPEGRHGEAVVEHFEVSESASRMTAMRGCRDFVEAGRYVRLKVGGRLFMSDTRFEKSSNLEVVRRAHGNVLIAGLGLGMILVPILREPKVKSVTVIESSADVIALIAPHFKNPKLTILCADIHDWRPAAGSKFNVIYFDIWADTSTDDLRDMAKLHQKFKSFKDRSDPDAWMDSWNRPYLKEQLRQERAHSNYW